MVTEITWYYTRQYYLSRISLKHSLLWNFPANIYLLNVNNRNTRKRCEICSKLTKTTPEQCLLWTYFTSFSSISIADFQQVRIFLGNYCQDLPWLVDSKGQSNIDYTHWTHLDDHRHFWHRKYLHIQHMLFPEFPQLHL